LARSDEFIVDQPQKEKMSRAKTLTENAFDPSTYEFDDSFTPGNPDKPAGVKTFFEMVECLDKNKDVEIDARVMFYNFKEKKYESKRMGKEKFMQLFKESEKAFAKFRETNDNFAQFDYPGANIGLVGDDFVPIQGGPFNKQLYLFDFLKAMSAAFWAYHHDPIAKASVSIIRDFTLGKGYRVDFKDPKHDALWAAFEETNNMFDLMSHLSVELSVYGEIMLWWLPNNETQINFHRGDQWEISKGYIPRIRLMDPSLFYDIITHPEDINFPLAYQWVSPTQYQIYTHVDGLNKSVSGSKFIYQQIPADQIIHEKVNCMSNEKRGRSDLFPALGYLKRLRDSVNYSIMAMQKSTAWSIDTTIEGNQTDLDNYVSSQQAIGTIAPAGSEFVHTAAVKREYLANQASSRGGDNKAFEWALNMCAAALRIPISYYGTHLSGGQTRASAIVSTEPVAKMFEMRQMKYTKILEKVIKGFFERMGIEEYDCEITWPEIITQDRSQKLKDLSLAEVSKWISPKTAATMASKEFQLNNFDYEQEMNDIKKYQSDEPALSIPLSKPGVGLKPNKQPQPVETPADDQSIDDDYEDKPSALTGNERAQIKKDLSN